MRQWLALAFTSSITIAALFACVGDSVPVEPLADGGSPGADASSGSDSGNGSDAAKDPARCNRDAPFGKPATVGAINTKAREGGGRLSHDGLRLYFHRGDVADLYVSERTSLESGFNTATPLSSLNSAADDYEPTLGDDESLLLFGSSRSADGKSRIWYARRGEDGGFSGPAEFFPDSGGGHSQPYLADNGRALYFTIRSTSTSELYVSHRRTAPNSGYTEWKRVPGTVPSSLDTPEGNAIVTGDELVLYFTRRGDNDTIADVFRKTRASQVDDFGPEELVDGLNSGAKDVPSWVSDDDCEILISSFRSGNGDILIARRPP